VLVAQRVARGEHHRRRPARVERGAEDLALAARVVPGLQERAQLGVVPQPIPAVEAGILEQVGASVHLTLQGPVGGAHAAGNDVAVRAGEHAGRERAVLDARLAVPARLGG
jgi:hypothetical protein